MRKWQDLCRAVNRLVLMLCVVGGAAVYMTVQSVAQPNEQDELEALTYVGTEACEGCHEELLQQLSKSVHGRALAAGERRGKGHLCEGCHGPGSGHVEDPIDEQQAAALRQVALQVNSSPVCHAICPVSRAIVSLRSSSIGPWFGACWSWASPVQ